MGAFSLPYQLLGNTDTIDYNTQTNQRGKFARVKVDIDLEKPTEKKLKIWIRKCLMMRGSHKFVTLMVRLVIIASFALSKFLRSQPVKMMITSIATMVAQGNLIQIELSFKDRRLSWIRAFIA